MAHTLHPEIEKRIKSCAKNIVWLKEYPLEDGCVEIIKFHLLPYLNLPQPIENEPLPEKEKLLWVDHPTNGDRWCKIYGYVENGITNITRVEYVDLPKEELKQPTPKIEKIDQQFAEKIVDWLINKYNLRYEPF